ncbi:hypothetical protein SKAU_G00346350 [Synaphobranchus kaupii]|uniref:Uncharacterized protein n=1 Tax=Synaphobranchus kaupii TaxID=118154 RepID=A0A9Q1EJL9_SYNKA|nr:hypothetical protein SKAU_G00346350 [Synaphobranchus kaupii]
MPKRSEEMLADLWTSLLLMWIMCVLHVSMAPYGDQSKIVQTGSGGPREPSEGQRVLSRAKRGWVWNQMFVLEEFSGPDPILVGRARSHAGKPCLRAGFNVSPHYPALERPAADAPPARAGCMKAFEGGAEVTVKHLCHHTVPVCPSLEVQWPMPHPRRRRGDDDTDRGFIALPEHPPPTLLCMQARELGSWGEEIHTVSTAIHCCLPECSTNA